MEHARLRHNVEAKKVGICQNGESRGTVLLPPRLTAARVTGYTHARALHYSIRSGRISSRLQVSFEPAPLHPHGRLDHHGPPSSRLSLFLRQNLLDYFRLEELNCGAQSEPVQQPADPWAPPNQRLAPQKAVPLPSVGQRQVVLLLPLDHDNLPFPCSLLHATVAAEAAAQNGMTDSLCPASECRW
jgi:hypothetical protein